MAVNRNQPARAKARTGGKGGGGAAADVGRGCIVSLIYVAIMVGASIILAGIIILSANEMFAFTKPDMVVSVKLDDVSSTSAVARDLKESKVISSKFLFGLYTFLSGDGGEYEAGTYELNSNMDYRKILLAISRKDAARPTVTITIPEGTTMADIFKTLEANGVCGAKELSAAAANYDFRYSFIKELAKGEKRLEGYLFPDTYIFYKNEEPARVLAKFLSNFEKKFDTEMKARASSMNLTVRELLTVASMVEEEAKFDEERPTIASVIYNRLKSKGFAYLQIDATVMYALGVHKEALSSQDLLIDNPYNTYKYKGLPPGPISNPGYAAISAALRPDSTGYYYYVAKKDGTHIFSRTKEEHQAAIARASREQ